MLAAGEATAVTAAQAALGAGAATVFARGAGEQSRAFSKLLTGGVVRRAAQLGDIARGAVSTIGAALAADVALTPGLVRVRIDASSEGVDAVSTIGAAPGAGVVAHDGGGALVHALNEDRFNAAAFEASVEKRRRP